MHDAATVVYARPLGWAGLARWVYRVGNTGTYPGSCLLALRSRRQPATAGSGPSCREGGLEAGGTDPFAYRVSPSGHPSPEPTLRARSLLPRPWRGAPWFWARALKTATFQVISCKVSQNDGVSPKYVKKACHSPCSQNGLGMSPLGILGFPFWRAFSHKELMVLFWPGVRLYCQNDEVSPDVHTVMSREVVVRYPLGLDSRPIPHLTQRGSRIDLFPDILNGP